MSKANPRKAVTAIMPLPLQVGTENGEPLVVRPMTLAMYAALERIGSPLLTGQEPENALDWLPTLYLVTHDPSEIFSGNLADKAFAWADAQPVSIVRSIRDAAMRQIDALVDVIPEADPDEKKNGAEVTDGSRPTQPTRRSTTAGATGRSCTKSRQAPSRCSNGRQASAKTRSSR